MALPDSGPGLDVSLGPRACSSSVRKKEKRKKKKLKVAGTSTLGISDCHCCQERSRTGSRVFLVLRGRKHWQAWQAYGLGVGGVIGPLKTARFGDFGALSADAFLGVKTASSVGLSHIALRVLGTDVCASHKDAFRLGCFSFGF